MEECCFHPVVDPESCEGILAPFDKLLLLVVVGVGFDPKGTAADRVDGES